MQKYNPSEIEQKWQRRWEEAKIYSPNLDLPDMQDGKSLQAGTAKKPFYNLMMFPYPSAEGMHVGNMYAFTGADVYGRFQRMQGKDVFEPIGLDGFGIHSENYAIKVGKHPVEQAKISEKNFYRQLKSIGNSFDWTRTVETYKPEYYKWTQWLFIQLFKAGLAYRKKAPVNFCPSCKTVLADEQVEDGLCERCNSMVEKRDLEQWFFKITKYADRLLNGLSQIDWAEKVKIAQKQWIGKSEGVNLIFKVKDMDIRFEMFDSVPQTFMAQTFTVIAPEHTKVYELVKGTQYEKPVMEFVAEIRKKKRTNKYDLEKKPEGIFTGRYLEYTPTGKLIPIWVASYAIYGYGTGIVNCSVHDERDFTFAKKYNIPLHPVMFPEDPVEAKKVKNLEYCYHHAEDGILQEPVEFKGARWGEVKTRNAIIKFIEKKGYGKAQSQYHLRDWLISRQRYWGPPIPMVFCQNCSDKGVSWFSEAEENEHGVSSSKYQVSSKDEKILNTKYLIHNTDMAGWRPVLEKDLPVLLPFIKNYKPLGTGVAPLASHPEFYKTKCPKCGGEAKRETDVSDTFLDSSWYFLRYLATDCNDIPFPMPKSKIKNQKSKIIGNWKLEIENSAQRAAWLPVNMYIGGAEHSVLHLLYSRFITMALKDLSFINFEEPFTKFRAHGLIVKDGAKMSKSKGNVVVPDAYIKKFGADALRCYLMFTGPFTMGGDFRDSGIEGMSKFLNRVWNLVSSKKTLTDGEVDIYLQKLTEEITEEINNLRYNTAISRLMMYYNFLTKKNVDGHQIYKSEIINFVKMIAPFAPHLADEMWEVLGQKSSVHIQIWPAIDKEELKNFFGFTIAIQVNGKTRATMDLEVNLSKEEAEKKAGSLVEKYLAGKKIVKIVYVEGKVINFVLN